MAEDKKDVYGEMPSEDDEILLEQLGRLARREAEEEERRFDGRTGKTPTEDETRDDTLGDTLDDAGQRLDEEIFRPLDDAFKARALRALKQQMRAEREGAKGGGGDAEQGESAQVLPFQPTEAAIQEATEQPTEQPSEQPIERAPERSPRRRFAPRPLLALAASLLLAVVALWLVPGVFERVESPSALPGYVAELTGERSETRSAPREPAEPLPELVVGDTFRLILRPEEDVAEDVAFELYLADAEGELRPWLEASDYARSESGSVRIEGVLGEELEIEPGRHTLVFLYGEPGALPEPATLDELASMAESSSWRHLTVPFRILLPPLAAGGPDVLFAGCYELAVSGGDAACVPHETLSIWARAEPGATFDILLDGEPQNRPGLSVDGGRRFTVRPGGGERLHHRLVVRAEKNGVIRSFELRLHLLDEPPWLLEARRLAVRGEAAEARRLLLERLESSSGGRVRSLLARLPGTGEEQRVAWLEEAVAVHRDAGRWSAMAEDVAMLASFDVAARRFPKLRARLDELATYRLQLPAEALFHLAYYRGILENDLGNARGALAALDEAATLARRLGLRMQLARASGEKALLLQRLGRSREAAELFASLELDAIPSPCERAQWLNNRGWSLLLDSAEHGDPLPPLERATELAGEHGCGGSLELNLHLNRALAQVLAGRVFEAERELALAGEAQADRELGSSPLHELWRLDIEGRLMMAAGRPGDALALYGELEEKAESAVEPRARWHARVQRAAAFEALGRLDEAIAELEIADAVVAAEGLEVPIGAGRGRFLADRESSSRRRIDLLLRQERTDEAFEVARRSRTRALEFLRQGHRLAHLAAAEQVTWDREVESYLSLRAEIEEETADSWQLSQAAHRDAEARLDEKRRRALAALDEAFRVFSWRSAELPALEEGELTLLYHPLDEGWVGFAATPGEAVRSHRFELPADRGEADLAERLLEPFRQLIESSRRLRLLPHGEVQAVDFHALPWDGGVLLDAAPVVYGLDVAVEPEPSRTGALILADARGDLPAARREADAVEAVLGVRFGGVTRLDGARATLSEVLPRLSGLALLHVAGHSRAAGDFAWESAILLAEEGRLTVGDVLTLEPAPADVVLSSCESAQSTGAEGIGLGLAQAFLVAGSSRVVASIRPVGDAASEELFRRFYDDFEQASGDVAERLRRAQLAWRAVDPRADWSSFRLLVP